MSDIEELRKENIRLKNLKCDKEREINLMVERNRLEQENKQLRAELGIDLEGEKE
jgi:cell shape-determining protein MreC